MKGSDENGNERFSEMAQLSGSFKYRLELERSLADIDNDGWKDLFITNGYLRDFTNMDFLKYTVADAMTCRSIKRKLEL